MFKDTRKCACMYAFVVKFTESIGNNCAQCFTTIIGISQDLSVLNSFIISITSSLLVSSRNSDEGSDFGRYLSKAGTLFLSAMMELFKFRAGDEKYLLNSVAIVRLSVTTSLLMVMDGGIVDLHFPRNSLIND